MKKFLAPLALLAALVAGSVAVEPATLAETPAPSTPVATSTPQPSSPAQAAPQASAPKAPTAPAPVRQRAPEHLRLWKFDARVIPVELDGASLVPPSDPKVLGWWGRPAGSARGATLLIGHTVSTGGGTLDDLELIPVGQIASVSGVRYRVERVEIISKPELARRAQRLFDQEGKHKLVLVTCEGFNPATRHYTKNVVVTARPVSR